MKKLLLILFVLPFFSRTQSEMSIRQFYHQQQYPDTFLLGFREESPVKRLEIKNVNLKANKDFYKRFSSAVQADWFDISDGYMACFSDQDRRTRVGYDKKGNWLNTVYSYPAGLLEKDIRHAVIYSYPDSKIIWVDEINRKQQHVYIIQISDDNQLKSIWVSEGDIHEIARQ